MTVERIRDLLLVLPFRPFAVKTPDGKIFSVPHPEFAMLSGTGRLLHVAGRDSDHEDIIDIALITSVDLTVPSES